MGEGRVVTTTDVVMGTEGKETFRVKQRGQGIQEKVKNSTNVRQKKREKRFFGSILNRMLTNKKGLT